jgi:putative hydrolase of the HAD superfamily
VTRGSNQLPRAVLLDLDDTILSDNLHVEDCWRNACVSCRAGLPDPDTDALVAAIDKVRDWFWADPDRHRKGRLDLSAARREIVRLSLVELGVDDLALAFRIADVYSAEREARMQPFPGAIDTVRWLRASGTRLALITNGSAAAQRSKIEKFELTNLFDLILIEGELGFGKPDPRVFERALEDLAVEPCDAWMVGDNLEWDVQQPQRMGMFAIWVDASGKGLPDSSAIRPDRIVRALTDLRH